MDNRYPPFELYLPAQLGSTYCQAAQKLRRGFGELQGMGVGIRSSQRSWRRRLTQRCLQFGCDKMCVSDQLEDNDSESKTQTEIQTATAAWG